MAGATPLQAGDGNATRTAIFNTLITEMEEMTPSQLADAVGTSRENAHHHLQWLVDAGLVVNDGGAYFAQPVFIDPDFQERITDALGDLAPHAEALVYVDTERPDEEQVNAVANCIHAAVALELIGDGPVQS